MPSAEVVGAFLCHAAAFGCTTGVALLAPSVVNATGAAPVAVTAATVLPIVVVLSASGVAGRLSDTFGSKAVVLAGAVIGSIGILVMSGSSRLAPLVAGGFFLGVGASGLFVPSLRQVGVSALPQHRVRSVSQAALGTPVGTLLIPPAALLIAERQSVAFALVSLACGFGLLGLVGGGLIANTRSAERNRARPGEVWLSALGRLAVAALAVSFAYYVPIAQLSAMADQIGFSGTQGAALVAAMGLSNLVGRYGAAYVVAGDNPSGGLRLSAAVVSVGVMVLACALWQGSAVLLIAGTVACGLGSGCFVVALPVAGLMESLGGDPGRSLGLLYMAMAPGAMLGPTAVSLGFTVGIGLAAMLTAAMGAIALVGSSLSQRMSRPMS
jgi:hypothetical protein